MLVGVRVVPTKDVEVVAVVERVSAATGRQHTEVPHGLLARAANAPPGPRPGSLGGSAGPPTFGNAG
jgi:hypothetical protein